EWTKLGRSRDWPRMPMTAEQVKGSEYVWFTIAIPGHAAGRLVQDPYLLFLDAHYEFEVYSGSMLLFRFGHLDDGEMPLLEGRPVFVPLEGYDPKKLLLLRIHTKQSNVITGKI